MNRADVPRGGTVEDNGRKPPAPTARTRKRIEEAARMVAGGMQEKEAAEALGVTAKAFNKLKMKHRELWDLELRKAGGESGRFRWAAGRARPKIRKATAMLAGGATPEDVAKVMGLRAGTIEHWRRLYRKSWKEERERAVDVVRTLAEQHPARQLRLELDARREPRASTPAAVSAEMTLDQFFHSYVWPDCLAPKGNTQTTKEDYEISLRYWQNLVGDRPLNEIDKAVCADFVRLLSEVSAQHKDQKLSANTIRKYWGNLQRLLNWAGPAGRNNRHGAGLLENPAWIEPPRKVTGPPRPGFHLEEIGRWLDVLPETAAPLPSLNGYDPVEWWRALILLDYNTGMRPETLFGVRWEMIDGHSLRIPPEVIKRRQGQLVWLNDAALAAIGPLGRSQGLVLAWKGWPKSQGTLRKERLRQQEAAGIRLLSLYALRRTFSTELSKINPIAAQMMMNHKGLGMAMMIDHYLDAESVLSDALAKLPQPEDLPNQGRKSA